MGSLSREFLSRRKTHDHDGTVSMLGSLLRKFLPRRKTHDNAVFMLGSLSRELWRSDY